jgi:hypothetical protein
LCRITKTKLHSTQQGLDQEEDPSPGYEMMELVYPPLNKSGCQLILFLRD